MRKTILAVDDDVMIHKLLSYSLEAWDNYHLVSMHSAPDAQAYLKEHQHEVNAIILDWEMPEMTGIEFLNWQKEQETYQDIPVIMLTGNNKKEDIKMGIDAGAYYYLIKPFNQDLLKSILSAAINDYLRLRELHEQVKQTHDPFANLVEGMFKIKTLEDASQMSVLISNTCSDPQEALIICEIFNNAIEHGNLGITYDEKSAFIEDNSLNEEVIKRLNEPKYRDRYATIDFLKKDGQLFLTVQDMGEGFDFEKFLEFDTDRVFESHGRGIAMVNSIFDVEYFGNGSKVQLKIPVN